LSSKADPADCLTDIVDNIARIKSYVVGMSRDNLANDVRTQDAAERCLERACEALSRLGPMAAVLLPGHPSAPSAEWATGCVTPTTGSASD
jgi:uncharacterized protein with HEPN domain